MTPDLPPLLTELAAFQRGTVTRAQLLRAGVSDKTVRTLVRHGRWQRMYPGVYATFSGEPSREAALWAAVLYAGRGAMLSYQTAAELWGLTDEPSPVIHLTVPSSRRVRARPGLVVHYSASAAAHPARTPPLPRVEDTVLDLWESARSLNAAVGWVTSAIGRRRTTAARLGAAMADRSRLRWRSKLTELLDMDGVHSVLEYRYVRDVERRHGLPTATRQLHTRAGGRSQYRDEVYEKYRTVVELDGRAAHPGDTRWADIRRDNAAAASGHFTLRYGWPDITITPCDVAAEIDDVLTRRGFAGARPCSPKCPVGRRSSRSSLVQARSARVLNDLGQAQRRERGGMPGAG